MPKNTKTNPQPKDQSDSGTERFLKTFGNQTTEEVTEMSYIEYLAWIALN
jgi:hypothetical protein